VLVVGLMIGLAAGVSPGPLLVLVITETLRSGWRAGVLAAAAPLVSDLVVVAGTLLVLPHLPGRALPILGVVGGCYVVWSGLSAWREAGTALPTADGEGRSSVAALRRAVVVNLLSPHPWLSWVTALGPLTVRAWRDSPLSGVALVCGFYLTLVGAKAVLAIMVAGGRGRLTVTGYRRALRAGGVLMVLAGLALAVEFLPSAITG
jgi:threonine/homoserine/homoserine lactone efflux protein